MFGSTSDLSPGRVSPLPPRSRTSRWQPGHCGGAVSYPIKTQADTRTVLGWVAEPHLQGQVPPSCIQPQPQLGHHQKGRLGTVLPRRAGGCQHNDKTHMSWGPGRHTTDASLPPGTPGAPLPAPVPHPPTCPVSSLARPPSHKPLTWALDSSQGLYPATAPHHATHHHYPCNTRHASSSHTSNAGLAPTCDTPHAPATFLTPHTPTAPQRCGKSPPPRSPRLLLRLPRYLPLQLLPSPCSVPVTQLHRGPSA